MESQKVLNYEEEAKKLDATANFERPEYWNPEVGKHELVAISELEKYEYTDDEGQVKKRASLIVESDGKQYTWSMGQGVTRASSYGQLIDLATKNGNKLTGLKFTVVVKSDGKKRDYTIV